MLKKVTDFKLPKEYNAKPNLNLLAQALRVYEKRAHVGLRKAKTRAEVNRTGKKVYKQKGTGGARHGSKRAPIFVGGGVAHGPRPIKRILTLPTKIKKLSKAMALSTIDAVFASGFATIKKTSEAQDFIAKLEGKRFMFLISEKNKDAIKKIKNLKNTKAILFKNANARDILGSGTLILDRDIFVKDVKTS